MKHLKKLIIVAGILVVLLGFAGGYFFKLALIPGDKDFIDADVKVRMEARSRMVKIGE
ncbi:hypothetical protein MX850_09420 [Erysipelothrix sp. Poltava]|nr:hypothetical protein MX850_09420 [Erysipelothrix sp. Poltava]